MTILITGGAGFIGTRLLGELEVNNDVVVIDNLHPQVHGKDAADPPHRPNVRFIRGDVTDPGMWDRLLPEVSATIIVHLAAETGTGQSLHQASRHANVNVNGTAVMLDALSRHKQIPEAFVLTSSRAVYGEGAWRNEETDESFYGAPRGIQQLDRGIWAPLGPQGQTGSPLPHDAQHVVAHPTNIYAATKLAQEHILLAWSASMSVSLSILRLQNVYGAGQALRNPYTGVLTSFARQILSGEKIEVYEGGDMIRDFVHVSDVVAALRLAIDRPPIPAEHRLVDIGSGTSDTLLHFAQMLSVAAGPSNVVLTNKYRLGDVRAAFASNERASEELGYQPRVNFTNGADELVEWARQEMSHGN